MRVYKMVEKPVWEEEEVICDVCAIHYDPLDDVLEVQEFISASGKGGYGSPFGDGNNWSIDICPRCAVNVLGSYIQIKYSVR